jgi:outer membrane receptor protein involved in Fe transport
LQQNAGVAYALQWRGVGELGLGLQRARVKRDSFAASDGSTVSSDDTTTLYNASAAVAVGPRFTIFASYSRGLEEAVSPPRTRPIVARLRR